MKLASVLLVGFIAAASAGRRGPFPKALEGKLPKIQEERIVGGEDVSPKYSIPHQVSFQIYGYHSCGGSILNENYVLTAAHCCEGLDPIYAVVVAGEHDQSYDEGEEQIRNVQKIIVHENFDYGTISNDICLLHVEKPFEFNDAVGAAKLPEQDQLFKEGTAIVSGWGTLYSGGPLPDILQRVEVPIVSDADCKDAYGDALISEQMICSGEEGKDSCQGDSGGPMTCGGLHCGIVSWGYGCAAAGYPGVYSETSHHVNWINSHIQL